MKLLPQKYLLMGLVFTLFTRELYLPEIKLGLGLGFYYCGKRFSKHTGSGTRVSHHIHKTLQHETCHLALTETPKWVESFSSVTYSYSVSLSVWLKRELNNGLLLKRHHLWSPTKILLPFSYTCCLSGPWWKKETKLIKRLISQTFKDFFSLYAVWQNGFTMI